MRGGEGVCNGEESDMKAKIKGGWRKREGRDVGIK